MSAEPTATRTAPLLFDDAPPPTPTRSLRRGMLLVLLIFTATRLLSWCGAYYGAFLLLRIEQHLDPPIEKHEKHLREQFATGKGAEFRQTVELLADFAPLCRFDGVHYRSIIEGGYRYVPPAPGEKDPHKLEQNIAFFPLFPLLCRPLTHVMSTRAAMVLVVHACSLAGGLLLYLWLRRRIAEPTALTAVALTFCWPAAVYYSFGYAEAVTLLLMVGALALIDLRQWLPAAVLAGLCTATRPTALAIAAVLALAFWLNRPRAQAARVRLLNLLPLGLIAVGGIAGYALFLTREYGSPLVYLANFKAGWVPDRNRADWLSFLTLTPVWEQFKYFRNLLFAPPIGLLNVANTLMWNTPLNLFILFLSLAGLRRVPASFRPLLALGPLIFLHAYLASGGAKFGIEPIARYTAVAVPAFVVLAAWMMRDWRGGWRTTLFVFLLLIQAAWALRFGMQEWSG